MKIRQFVNKFVRDERGVTALEYAILAGLIVTAVVAGVTLLSTGLSSGFSNLAATVTSATS